MRKNPHAAVNHLTFLTALLALFSLQLFTFWNENIFRLSLTKLSMGNEMYGLLLIFIPLLFLLCPKRFNPVVFFSAVAILLLTRTLCPYLSPPFVVIVAAIGIASSLLIACFALSCSDYSVPAPIFAKGVGLGVLLSITLRAWGSSYDISTGGPGILIGWGLLGVAGFLVWMKRPEIEDRAPFEGGTIIGSIVLAFGLFGNLAMVYWFLSAPAVVSCWSETNYFISIVILYTTWILVVGPLARFFFSPGRSALLFWNLSFTGSLLLGIFWQTVDYPASPTTPALVVTPAPMSHQIPFYLMLLLSPVVLANLNTLLRYPRKKDPQSLVVPLLLGTVFLVALTILLTFTNTWGYVGWLGPHLRGKFYLPFLLAAAGMILPLVRGFPNREENGVPSAGVFVLAVFLGVAGIGGAWVPIVALSSPPAEKELTILTYNMQLGSEKEGSQNYHAQLELLRQIDADIIGLQESDTARPSGGNVDATRFFADSLVYDHYFGPSTISGTYGTAILSRFPLKNPRTLFTYSTTDEIGTAVAEVSVMGRTITVMNSHPAGRPTAKHAHVDALLDVAEAHESVICMGDFNFRQTSVYYERMVAVLKDPWLNLFPTAQGPRHPSIGAASGTPVLLDMTDRIDHIFLSPGFSVEESYYLPVPESQTDHPAHWCVVTWE